MTVKETINLVKHIIKTKTNTFFNDKRMKISDYDFVCALIFQISSQKTRSFSLRNLLKKINLQFTEEVLCWPNFWARLKTSKLETLLTDILKALLTHLKNELSISENIFSNLGIQKLFILDSTSCSLPDRAQDSFPAPRKNTLKSAIKCHVLLDLFSACIHWVCLTPGTVHDSQRFPPFELLKNSLILMDLGYYDYSLFLKLMTQQIYFLSRVKKNSSVKILKVVSGISKRHPKDFCLKDLKQYRSNLIEFIGQVRFEKSNKLSCRFIGVWNCETLQYHWYMTNLPKTIKKEKIWPLYRVRWQIELYFKGFKSTFPVKELSSSNERIIKNIFYACLIASFTSSQIATAAANEIKDSEKLYSFSLQKSSAFFSDIFQDFFNFLFHKKAFFELHLLRVINFLKNYLFDPNFKKRKTSIKTVFHNLCAVT